MKCEACGTGGYKPQECVADEKHEMIIGPCCFVSPAMAERMDPEKLHYGLELSSHLGLSVYAEYDGLKLEFRKTADQVKKFIQDLRTPGQVPAAQMVLSTKEGSC